MCFGCYTYVGLLCGRIYFNFVAIVYTMIKISMVITHHKDTCTCTSAVQQCMYMPRHDTENS